MTERKVRVRDTSGERIGRWAATVYDGNGVSAIVVLNDGKVITAPLSSLTVIP